jgi:hypothetical protein
LNESTIRKSRYQRPLSAATAMRSPILSVMIPKTPIWVRQAISSLSLMVHATKQLRLILSNPLWAPTSLHVHFYNRVLDVSIRQDPALSMQFSLCVTLGIFLLLAIRDPSASRSVIAFTSWSSFAHAALMCTQACRNMVARGELIGWPFF